MARVVLRPVTQNDLDVFEAEFSTPDGTGAYQWFGYSSPFDLRHRFAETGLLTPEGGTLAVGVEDDAVAGRVEWFKSLWGRPETSWCWTVAIGLRPSYRGRGIGTEAQRLLVTYLFDHTRAQRIQAFTDSANLAEQRALEKAGFEREGVLRQAQWRAGRWHDQILYSTLRTLRHQTPANG
ncbi:MAG TPA: GNAT family protein [Streptosporangiaceae bacterium]|nr:GNAT family protein [Streptosporangiaceae bacterium]